MRSRGVNISDWVKEKAYLCTKAWWYLRSVRERENYEGGGGVKRIMRMCLQKVRQVSMANENYS